MQPSFAKNPTKIVCGNRAAKQGIIRTGCSVTLFGGNRSTVLLTRRADNGQWCLPGGMFEAGETVTEGCEREMLEETGLKVRVARLIGVYSDPDQLTVYPDGNKVHAVVLGFEVEQTGGQLSLNEETTEARFFPVEQALQMDLFHCHIAHLRDALSGQMKAFIR